MRKNYLLSLLFVGLFGVFSCTDSAIEDIDHHAAEAIEQQSEVLGEPADSDADFQFAAQQQLERLNAHFADKPYPGYFGGAYIGDDGKLVVWIKGNAKKLKPQMAAILGTDDVVIRRARHSFNDLNRVMNELNVFKADPANAAVGNNIAAFSLMDLDNDVLVELLEYNEGKMKEFKTKVMNSPAIRFIQSDGLPEEEALLQPGCKASTGSFAGSYAFRASNGSGQVGMVTSGHLFTSVGQLAYENGVVIGECTATNNSGSVDAAFVRVYNPSSYTPSNSLCVTNSILSTATSRPGSGTVINKTGQSTGRTSGKIISTNATVTFSNGKTYTNLTSADYSSSGGDSGGLVYTYISSTGTLYTVGVHKGSGTNAYFTKADLALSQLGVSRY